MRAVCLQGWATVFPAPSPPIADYLEGLTTMESLLFQSLDWRCLRPHRGGRVVAVAGPPTEPGTFYFGACAGGVWKTTNGGSHWENVSDGYFTTAAVGALAVSPSHPEVLYAGTGEATIRGNVSH